MHIMSIYVQGLHHMCNVLYVQPIYVLCLSKSAWKISVYKHIVNILCKKMLKFPRFHLLLFPVPNSSLHSMRTDLWCQYYTLYSP